MSFNFKDAQLTYFNQDLQLTSKLKGVFLTTVTPVFGSITLDTVGSTTVSLKGLIPVSGTGTPPNVNPGDIVIAQPNVVLAAGLSFAGAFISAANTLTIALNNSAATQTPANNTWVVAIFKFGQLDGLSQ